MAKFIHLFALCSLWAVATALPTNLVVGGEEALEGEFPYQVRVESPHVFLCGGSLVQVSGTQVVITTAQCVQYPDDQYLLIAGDLKRNDTSGHEQRRRSVRRISHEGFTGGRDYSNDIALLIPDQPFDLNEWVQPIPLPQRMLETIGSVVISGWGASVATGGDRPNVLRKVVLPTIDDVTCQAMYDRMGQNIAPSMLCAGVGGKGGCDGDGGGPLKSVEGGYLAGISSWGMGCAREGYPDVNTEVSHFIDWINDEVSRL